MTASEKTRYSGELQTRLPLLPAVGHAGGPTAPEIVAMQKQLIAHKQGELMRHYEIDTADPDCWYLLTCALAFKHVPGFQVEQRGADKFWTHERELELYEAVNYRRKYRMVKGELVLRKKPASISLTCSTLSKEAPFNALPSKSDRARAEALRVRYENLRKFYERRDAAISKSDGRPPPDFVFDRSNRYAPSRIEVEKTLAIIRADIEKSALDQSAAAIEIALDQECNGKD